MKEKKEKRFFYLFNLQNNDYMDKVFYSKNEIRHMFFNFARQDNILTETDLRKMTLNNLLDIWEYKLNEAIK